MTLLRIATAVVLAALASACASSPPVAAEAPPAEILVQGQAAERVAVAEAAPAAPAAGGEPVPAEDDFAAIYGQNGYDPVADPTLPQGVELPASYDPWEGFNRGVHRFNNAVDRTVARPLALGYVAVVPRPVRLGVSNFFNNLGQPLSAVNALLQGKPGQAGQSLARFVMNSTLGIGGIFDPASGAKLANRSEDFGQTLGVWGWRRSRYVELPLFGPRTVRDVFGLIGDAPLSPIRQIGDDQARVFLQGLQLVDVRTQLLSIDSLREGAVDEYALYRDSWLQRRNYQIGGGFRTQDQDQKLPDYLLEEEENPTVPANAMPVIIPAPGG
jgi:phospholipid-binding lipoprotein MlaA